MEKQEIHRYELVERIAVGGMAEVFRAKTYGLHGFEKQLAVKRILPELASSREFVDRFIREAKIAVTLSHANIVQVMDFSRFGDSLYIAMEYVDGIDLSALLKSLRQAGQILPIPAALHIAIEVFKGLDFAHAQRVVHRDMSPANILLSRAGEVKIADFGIAQATEGKSSFTKPNRIMGKWRYMSPEQTSGTNLTSSSDVFSTGVVLFEVFTGRKLFDQETAPEIVAAIRGGHTPRASDVRPDLPKELDELLLNALQLDSEARNSAATLGRSFVELSYANTLPVTPTDLADVVRQFVSQRVEEVENKTSSSFSGNLIDDIINSELSSKRPGVNTRLTRMTPLEPVPALDREPPEGTVTSYTFVEGGVGDDGLTQWLLSAAPATPGEVEEAVDESLDGPPAGGWQRRTEPMEAFNQRQTLHGYAQPTVEANAPRLVSSMGLPGMPPPSVPVPVIGHRSFDTSDIAHMPRPSRRWPYVLALAAAAAIAAVVVFIVRAREAEKAATVKAPPRSLQVDTATDALTDTIEIHSEPDGATLWIEGVSLEVSTPAQLPLEDVLGKDVMLVLDGYSSCSVHPGQGDQHVQCALQPRLARLVVTSDPPGARVSFRGLDLGTTPVEVDVEAGEGELKMSREGFRPESRNVVALSGETLTWEETLREKTRIGTVDLFVKPWANVYFRGKKISEAPVKGLRLPIGTHSLKLKNPVTGDEKTIQVTVPSDSAYNFKLP